MGVRIGYKANMSRYYLTDPQMNMPFAGAKLALYLGRRLAVILRDDRSAIPFPDHWDLPGGGREPGESPLACALRETREELGLTVPPAAVHWGRPFREGGLIKWFFVATLGAQMSRDVVLGDEGQTWTMMEEAEFLAHPRAVPQFKSRLGIFVAERDTTKSPPLP